MSQSRKDIKRKKAASKHGTGSVPSEANEFLRLIARILRRRTDLESAEHQSQDAVPGVAPTEHPDVEDESKKESG